MSAGYGDGNVAEFWVDGEKIVGTGDMPNRGLNVIVLEPTTLTPVKKCCFDTHESSENSYRFAKYIDEIQDGMIVLVAVKDEAMNNLNDRGRSVFASIGGQSIVNEGPSAYRCSYALIGIKGGSGLAEQDRPSGQGKVEIEAQLQANTTGAFRELDERPVPGECFPCHRSKERMACSAATGLQSL